MKQTIEIEVPDGKVAVWEDGKVVFKDAKPPLPKTWLEFARTQNYDTSQTILGVPRDITLQHVALLRLHKLRDCYRQGWVPNRDDYEQDNWCIKYNCEIGFCVSCYPYDRYFLSFPTKELANEFLNNFRDLIKQAGDLI